MNNKPKSMSSPAFVKQVLVEQGELDRLRQRQFRDYSPEIRSMITLQEQIVNTLLRTDIDPQQKLQLISGPQQRFTRLKEETNTLSGSSSGGPGGEATQAPTATPPNTTAQQPTTKAEKAEVKSEPEKTVPLLDLQSLGIRKNYRDQAERFLHELTSRKTDVISRSDQNELVLNGQAVAGSNFNKLYTALFTPNGSANIIGMPELLHGLRQLQIPIASIVSVPIKKAFTSPIARTGPLHKNEQALDRDTLIKDADLSLKQESNKKTATVSRKKSSKGKKSKEEVTSTQSGHGLKSKPRILYLY